MSDGIKFDCDGLSPGGWLVTHPEDVAYPLTITNEDGRELVRVEQDGSVVYESVEDLEDALRLIPQAWSAWRPTPKVRS